MTKAFLCKYLNVLRDAVNREGSGGGGGVTLAPYMPAAAAGYTNIELKRAPTLTTAVTAFTNKNINAMFYIAKTAPAVGSKVCIYGQADDDGAPVGFAMWGVIRYYHEYTSDAAIRFSEFHGISYVKDGAQTTLRKVGTYAEANGGSINLAEMVGEAFATYPQTGYKVEQAEGTMSLSSLKNYWTNKTTTVQFMLTEDPTLANGDKVLIKGKTNEGAPFAMWGIATGVSQDHSAGVTYTKLSQYDGFSYAQIDETANTITGETHTNITGSQMMTTGAGQTVDIAVQASIYYPTSGYALAATDGQQNANTLANYISNFTNKPAQGSTCRIQLMSTAPAKGDKVLIKGVAKDTDGTFKTFAMWGEVSSYTAYSTYASITLQTFEGLSYAKNGSQTLLRTGAALTGSDGGSITPADLTGAVLPYMPAASSSYTRYDYKPQLTLSVIKAAWKNQDTTVNFRIGTIQAYPDDLIVVKGKASTGEPFAIWGKVGTRSYVTTGVTEVTLARFDGFSYASIVNGAVVAETYTQNTSGQIQLVTEDGNCTVTCESPALTSGYFSNNGTFTPPSGTAYNSVTVDVQGGSTPVANPLFVDQNGYYAPPYGEYYSDVMVNVPTGGGSTGGIYYIDNPTMGSQYKEVRGSGSSMQPTFDQILYAYDMSQMITIYGYASGEPLSQGDKVCYVGTSDDGQGNTFDFALWGYLDNYTMNADDSEYTFGTFIEGISYGYAAKGYTTKISQQSAALTLTDGTNFIQVGNGGV